MIIHVCFCNYRSIRAKHFLIHEDGVVKLSGLRSITSMIEEGARMKVHVRACASSRDVKNQDKAYICTWMHSSKAVHLSCLG